MNIVVPNAPKMDSKIHLAFYAAQLAAALARISSTSDIDENWMWDITPGPLFSKMTTLAQWVVAGHWFGSRQG